MERDGATALRHLWGQILPEWEAVPLAMVQPPRSSQEAVLYNLFSGHWNSTEDRKIAEHILKRGNRWSEIAKALGKSRTEHMVKNRLKTMLIRLRKRYGEEATDEELLVRFTHEE